MLIEAPSGLVRSIALRAGRGEGRSARSDESVVDDSSVTEEDDPVGPRREMGVVGDHDRGDAALAGVEDHRASRPRRWSSRAHPTARRRGGACARRPRPGRWPPAGAHRPRADRGSGRLGRPARAARARRVPPGCALRAGIAVELEGQRDVLRGGEPGQEVEILEDVADRPPTKARLVVARHRSRATRPPMRTSPLVGSSRLPAMVSRVDFPEPLGPITATRWPSSTERSISSRARTAVVALAVGLRDLVEFEQAHRGQTVLRRNPRHRVGVGHPNTYSVSY